MKKNLSFMFLLVLISLFQNFSSQSGTFATGQIIFDETDIFQPFVQTGWVQGIWKFQNKKIFLISEDVDGREMHTFIRFHLVDETGKRLWSKDILGAGTHAQSIYVKYKGGNEYDVFTENATRDGISHFTLNIEKNYSKTDMIFNGDFKPKIKQGQIYKPIRFHVFAVNPRSNLLVTGQLSSKGFLLQRFDSTQFFNSQILNDERISIAIPKFEPFLFTNINSLQGVGLSKSKAFILTGKKEAGIASKVLYVANFKTKSLEQPILIKEDDYNEDLKSEPEGLYVQANQIIFGIQSGGRKNRKFKLYSLDYNIEN